MAEQTQAQRDAEAADLKRKHEEETAKRNKGKESAVTGANKLVDYLAASGTGRDKINVAREVLTDLGTASTEEDGAKAVVTHLRRRGLSAEGTFEKAERFIANGLENPDPVAGVFFPGTTQPGVVAVMPNRSTGQTATPVVPVVRK